MQQTPPWLWLLLTFTANAPRNPPPGGCGLGLLCAQRRKRSDMGRLLWLLVAVVVASTAAEERAARCKSFCDRAMKHCRGDDAAYDDRAECDRECAVFSDDGTTDIVGNNSLPCREFWLTRIEQMLEQSGRIAPG